MNRDPLVKIAAVLGWAVACVAVVQAAEEEQGFVELFNGKNLEGWRASENPDSFRVEDGELVAHGKRSHLFYTGPVNEATFDDFEARLVVMTKPGANAGFYFHTEFQEEGWPAKGHEAQINATQKDPKKTGSLYGVVNVMNDAPHKDNEWFDYHIRVVGQRIVIKVNGEVTVDYEEPVADVLNPDRPGRKLSKGTIAIQCHDPDSEVRIKSIRIKPL